MMVDCRTLLVLACIILQILDGLFTAHGVMYSSLGLNVEANPFVKTMMSVFGIIPGIFLVKTSGIAILRFMQKLQTPTYFFAIICGIYSWVVYLWVKVTFVDNLIR
jgi:hypothetical protein